MLLRCIEGKLSQFDEVVAVAQDRAAALPGLKAELEAGSSF